MSPVERQRKIAESAERALEYLEHTEGAGKPVVCHALETIRKLTRLPLWENDSNI